MGQQRWTESGGDHVDTVRRAVAGDNSARAELYRDGRATVAAVAWHHVHSRADVDDVVQETFARAFDRLDRLVDPERFTPWIASMARHVAIDMHRRGRRTTSLAGCPEVATDGEGGWVDDTADDRAASKVRIAVDSLSERDSLALRLVSELGAGPREVGLRLGISPGAAKVVVHRARRRLRLAVAADALAADRVECAQLVDRTTAGLRRHLEHCSGCWKVAEERFGRRLAGPAVAGAGRQS